MKSSMTFVGRLICKLQVVALVVSLGGFAHAADAFMESGGCSYTYDEATGIYKLQGDFWGTEEMPTCDLKIDLNGHSFGYNTHDGHGYLNTKLELINTAQTGAAVECGWTPDVFDGGELIIGEGVRVSFGLVFMDGGPSWWGAEGNSTLRICKGAYFKKWGPVMGPDMDWPKEEYNTMYWDEKASIIVEEGAYIWKYDKYEGFFETDVSFYDSVTLFNFMPSDCILSEPDADGFCLVRKPPQDVAISTSSLTFSGDVATGARSISDCGTTETFTHSVNAWGEAAAQSTATVTFSLNGGAAQTLGTYADAATATWSPTKSGEYLFTHTPGSGITARFFVNLPYEGSGTAEDPYLVGNTAAFNEVAAKGGYVTLLGDIAASASVPSGRQYSALSGSRQIEAGNKIVTKMSLVSFPGIRPFDLNTIQEGVDKDDSIIFTDDVAPLTYTPKLEENGKWSWGYDVSWYEEVPGPRGMPVLVKRVSRKTDDTIVPVGVGFWYASRGGSPTVKW